ncbi:methyl-accepting chemotaxis protein [Pseudoalteromonas sp. SSM20]|uniref:methyl-accepting chemotaxis protein n=1 Tax=Pseudoalteromonas sp. SSM20 TaxID=3139394 RepID=UPI003BAB5D46
MLKNLPILLKLLLILLIPSALCGMLIYQLNKTSEVQITAQFDINKVIALTQGLNNVAHNFAVERGISAGFLGSRGAEGKQALAEQRLKADKAAEALLLELDKIKTLSLNKHSIEVINTLKKQFAERETVRSKVDTLTSDSDFFAFYSSLNANAITLTEKLSVYITEPTLAAKFKASIQLIWLKEHLGQVRGALNGIFAKGDYAKERATQVNQFLAQLVIRERQFKHYANDEYLSLYETLQSKKEVENVKSMTSIFTNNVELRNQNKALKVLLSQNVVNQNELLELKQVLNELKPLVSNEIYRSLSGEINSIQPNSEIATKNLKRINSLLSTTVVLPKVDAKTWFLNATEEIKLVNGLIQTLSSEISTKAQQTLTNTQKTIEKALYTVLAFLLISLVMGYLIARSIKLALNQIQQTIEQVQQDNNYSLRVPLKQKDEIGKTADNINSLLGNLRMAFDEITTMSDALANGRYSDINCKGSYTGDLASLVKQIETAGRQVGTGVGEISSVMSAVKQGDFSNTIQADLKGQLGQLKEDVNNTVIICDQSFSAITSVVTDLAHGNLNNQYANDLTGEFGNVLNAAIQCRDILQKTIEQEIQQLVDAASKGKLDVQIKETGKEGCFLALTVGINKLQTLNRQVIGEVDKVFANLAKGSLATNIAGNFDGAYARLQQNANKTILTLEQIIEKEIANIVDDCLTGELSTRINTHGKEGFFLSLSQSLNNLVSLNQNVISELNSVANSLANGNLNVSVVGDYKGEFNSLKVNINKSLSELSQVIEVEVQEVINELQVGNLDKRIDSENKQGCFLQLSDGVNQIISVVSQVLNDLDSLFENLVSGDLTARVTTHYDGQFKRLKENANNTVSKLDSLLSNLLTLAQSVSNSVHEIAHANEDLRRRTESQASAVEQTSVSVQRVNESAKVAQSNLMDTEQLMLTMQTNAKSGQNIAFDAKATMQQVSASSERIKNIIGVIDEIAFQTNLLALNAAVEAARAGEHGRGFSVVASEVRNLAQRSAQSANEIKSLITSSVEQVTQGNLHVDKSSEALVGIASSITNANEKMEEIAEANKQQTASFNEINIAVNNIEQSTQQNAAMVEQIASSAAALNEETKRMVEEVNYFKVS